RFFEQADFHFSASPQYPELFDLDIIRADGSCLCLTTWVDEASSSLMVGFGEEESIFQRLALKPMGQGLYEYQRKNLCFFIDGIIACIAEIESIAMSNQGFTR
ncbi:MAG: hypothetical protein ACTMIA_16890, partial [Vibrio sp.]